MKKKLMNNWSLKIMSAFLALVLWVVIVNIDNPVESKKIYVDVEILNGDVLNRAGTAWSIVESKRVGVFVYARKTDLKNIAEGDIKLTADLNTLWPANGTIGIQTEIVNHKDIIEKVELSTDTLRVKTENLQRKAFDVELHATGNLVTGYIIGNSTITPDTLEIEGPESVIGQINSVGIQVDVSDALADISGLADLMLYDANGNELTGIENLTFSREQFEYSVSILKAKQISLDFVVNGIPAEGYQYIGYDSSVQNLMVAGTDERISAMENLTISVDELSVAGATDSVTAAIDIQNYIPEGVSVIGLESTVITVVLKVEALLQKIFVLESVEIDILNKNSNYTYDIISGNSGEIQIIVEGLKGDLDLLRKDDLHPYLDVKNMESGVHDSLVLLQLSGKYQVINTPKITVSISDPDQTTIPVETSEQTTPAEDGSTEVSAEDTLEVEENT